ncbi:hypothetical protein, partial [Lysobacter capsici]|uniref:hypothetical protein n=1 Tax=Lysobacter capsici TaxID=435897 RepID=UPI00398D3547
MIGEHVRVGGFAQRGFGPGGFVLAQAFGRPDVVLAQGAEQTVGLAGTAERGQRLRAQGQATRRSGCA